MADTTTGHGQASGPGSVQTQRRNDDPQASGTLVAVIIGAILVFASIVSMQAYYYTEQEAEMAKKVYQAVPEELTRVRTSQLEQLNSYRWVDASTGIVAIPIQRAMELVVRDQGKVAVRPAPPPASTERGTP